MKLITEAFEAWPKIIRKTTIAKFLERIVQFYEQGANLLGIGQYIQNWLRWVKDGIIKEALAPHPALGGRPS
jgi:hypothetical protein